MLSWEIRAVFITAPHVRMRLSCRSCSPCPAAAVPHSPSSLPLPHAFRHVNIGNQFQAELPDLQDPARLEEEEEGASLVWKPWGDIETNPETQEKGFSNASLPLSPHPGI